jgi:hypothetical protein
MQDLIKSTQLLPRFQLKKRIGDRPTPPWAIVAGKQEQPASYNDFAGQAKLPPTRVRATRSKRGEP